MLKTFNSDGAHDPITPPVLHGAGGFFFGATHMKPTHAQVTQVVAYRTNDGELHATAHEANAHAAKLNFIHWYRRGGGLVKEEDVFLNAHDVADWLADNSTVILDFLIATKGE